MNARRNRRATTDGRVIRDNRIFDFRVLSDGFAIARSEAFWYRRKSSAWPGRYTGLCRLRIKGIA